MEKKGMLGKSKLIKLGVEERSKSKVLNETKTFKMVKIYQKYKYTFYSEQHITEICCSKVNHG